MSLLYCGDATLAKLLTQKFEFSSVLLLDLNGGFKADISNESQLFIRLHFILVRPERVPVISVGMKEEDDCRLLVYIEGATGICGFGTSIVWQETYDTGNDLFVPDHSAVHACPLPTEGLCAEEIAFLPTLSTLSPTFFQENPLTFKASETSGKETWPLMEAFLCAILAPCRKKIQSSTRRCIANIGRKSLPMSSGRSK